MHPETSKQTAPCFVWIVAVLAVGATLWYLLYSLATAQKALAIQEDVSSRSVAALATQAALVNVSAEGAGRDIRLTGLVDSDQARQQAEQIILDVKGVRAVVNAIEVVDALPQEANPVVRSTAKIEALPDEFSELAEGFNDGQSESIAAVEKSIEQLDLDNIAFLHGSATLTEQASSTLDTLVEALNQHATVKLRVEGHTDNTGDPTYNLDLSAERAQAVVDYMVAAGIERKRLEASGYGDRHPIATNETLEGRSKNRRIEFKLINGEN